MEDIDLPNPNEKQKSKRIDLDLIIFIAALIGGVLCYRHGWEIVDYMATMDDLYPIAVLVGVVVFFTVGLSVLSLNDKWDKAMWPERYDSRD